ncbi:MAG: hypothetical protein GC190_12625 [Alphaproteobacteria bacterium]|nr:hypothetical protein [Alphaproteobacteria bacterium]
MDETDRRKAVIAARETDIERWRDPKQLEAAWEARAVVAAQLIPAGMRVADIGCGAMRLEAHLPFACTYVPSDVVKRDERTVVADLNAADLPEEFLPGVDIVAMLGVWEYLYNPERTFAALARAGKPLVTSYCAVDLAPHFDRGALGWVNEMTGDQFVALAAAHGYRAVVRQQIDAAQCLFKFERTQAPVRPQRKRVHVLSYYNAPNFGDRLGFHQLSELMPAHADVTWGTHAPFTPVQENTDLLIIGIGNSLFKGLLTEDLFKATERAKKTIGIFGTQYRESLPPDLLARLLDRLDHWFARYEDDIRLYARGRENVSHLGDWLINSFPMARGTIERRMTVPHDIITKEFPLDRLIQFIQQHRSVFSARLHPLLCALTSAEEVAYQEQRELPGSSAASGKFASMLFDIFGRTYPEGSFWQVDRECVAAYKAKVSANTDALRSRLNALL